MCDTMALLKAKREIKLLKEDIEDLKHPDPLPKGFPVFKMAWTELVGTLKLAGLEAMVKAKFVADGYITYTDSEHWAKIVPYLVSPADLFVDKVADCDDYSRWAAAESSKLFQLTGCLQCWGKIPQGYHAWNLVITPAGVRYFEPNGGYEFAGVLFQNDHGYIPKSWK